jgi:tripartite-type tricarboxylate transporter receptor subunit TctC
LIENPEGVLKRNLGLIEFEIVICPISISSRRYLMERTKKKCILKISLAVFLLFTFFVSYPAQAQTYPDRPIEYIVLFAAGGSTDISVRTICEIAAKELGQPFVVLNKPGGGGSIAIGALAKAGPDGYTIGSLSSGAMEIQPHLIKVPYDPIKDIVPIMQYGEYPQGLAVKADAPFDTFKDLVEFARKNPGKVTYGTTGVGGTQHIMMERIATAAGIKWSHVPFKGGTPAITALLGGHITATTVAEFVPQVKAGAAKLLAVFGTKRLSDFPNVPTLMDMGYNIYMANYLAIGAPAGTPKDRLDKLGNAFKNAMSNPAFVEMMKKWSIEIIYKPGSEIAKIIQGGYKVHGEIIKQLGLKE